MNATDRLTGPAGLALDVSRRTVTVSETVLALSVHETNLLRVLLEDRGRVLTFDELARRAWGYEASDDQRYIYTAAWRLRRRLAAAGAPNVVEGVRGIGYWIPQEEIYTAPNIRAVAVFDPMNPEWLLSMANDAIVELSGYSVEELTMVPGAAMSLWRPGRHAALEEMTERAVTVGPTAVRGERLMRAAGGSVEVDIAVSRLDLPGVAPQVLAVVTPAAS